MNVRLVAITKPVIPEADTAGEFVAYAARVSNPANQGNKETAPRLLEYLRRNAHWSPFEMASATLEITTTRDIARQILRHRSFSFQEFSQRYAEATEFAAPIRARLQDNKNRQNSVATDDEDLQAFWDLAQDKIASAAVTTYREALDAGIAKEVARKLLPEGLTVSRLYMAGTLRSWLHYIELRTSAGTQLEHREIAESCQRILGNAIPEIFQPWKGNANA